MLTATLLAIVQATGAAEALPVDERMAAYEAAMPRLREVEARVEADIGRLGPAESGWAASGLSVTRRSPPDAAIPRGTFSENGSEAAMAS